MLWLDPLYLWWPSIRSVSLENLPSLLALCYVVAPLTLQAGGNTQRYDQYEQYQRQLRQQELEQVIPDKLGGGNVGTSISMNRSESIIGRNMEWNTVYT